VMLLWVLSSIWWKSARAVAGLQLVTQLGPFEGVVLKSGARIESYPRLTRGAFESGRAIQFGDRRVLSVFAAGLGSRRGSRHQRARFHRINETW
jgi:hypothetical protein